VCDNSRKLCISSRRSRSFAGSGQPRCSTIRLHGASRRCRGNCCWGRRQLPTCNARRVVQKVLRLRRLPSLEKKTAASAFISASKYSQPKCLQPTTIHGTTTPSQHVWSSGFLRCWSDGMKLASGLSPGPCSVYRQLQIGVENSSFYSAVGTSSALEAMCDALLQICSCYYYCYYYYKHRLKWKYV